MRARCRQDAGCPKSSDNREGFSKSTVRSAGPRTTASPESQVAVADVASLHTTTTLTLAPRVGSPLLSPLAPLLQPRGFRSEDGLGHAVETTAGGGGNGFWPGRPATVRLPDLLDLCFWIVKPSV